MPIAPAVGCSAWLGFGLNGHHHKLAAAQQKAFAPHVCTPWYRRELSVVSSPPKLFGKRGCEALQSTGRQVTGPRRDKPLEVALLVLGNVGVTFVRDNVGINRLLGPNELKLSDRGWRGQTMNAERTYRQPLFAGARG